VIAAISAGLVAAPTRAVDDLRLNVAPGSESVMPGEIVTVTLTVANLSRAINGVQALIHYDDTLLTLIEIAPTDLGLLPPAEGWVEVHQADVGGDITYAVVVNGSSTVVNGTVATLTFTASGEGVTSVTFRPGASPFYTKLTVASDNSTVFPNTFNSGNIVSTCSDGLFCNGLETLVGVSCQAGTPPDCTVLTDQCNNGVCNESTDTCQAQPVNEGGVCNDQDLCTQTDRCTAGVCAGTPVDCSSLDDACNQGVCNPATGACQAVPTNEGGSCDDAVFCNGTDTCLSGACVSSGDPCAPLLCDEVGDRCFAPLQVANLEVFYAGRFGNNADPSKSFLAGGSTATGANITNYMRGITGIRVYFNAIVSFATTPAAAFNFEWTTDMGTLFSPVTDPQLAITVTPAVVGNATVVTIVLNDEYARRRWLKVTINASQVTTGGVALDGEMAGNPVVLPSGNGGAGGNAVFFLGNMGGDVDGDRKTLLTDIGLIRAAVNPFLSVPITNVYDVDRSGKVLLTDVGDAREDVNPFYRLPLITP
jgi:hypothetical protein